MKQAKTPQRQSTNRFPARIASHLTAAILLLGAVAACTGGNGEPSPESRSAAAGEGQTSASPQASTADEASPPASSQSVAAPSASTSAPAPSENPATAKLKQTVTDALRKVAAGNPKPSQILVTDALTGAGLPAASLEVSVSRTPTGLEVDAIEAAALHGKDCVVGQIRDGGVMVTVLPVLASGKCFVGSPL
ncbi:hypothetical protein V3C33_10000 [Micrococcaceae bacterium Sec5.7]